MISVKSELGNTRNINFDNKTFQRLKIFLLEKEKLMIDS